MTVLKPTGILEHMMMRHGDPPDEQDDSHIEAVGAAMELLPEFERELLFSIFYMRSTYEELSEQLGCSKPWAWRQAQRALQLLKGILERDAVINRRYHLFTTWNDACRMVVESYGRTTPAEHPLELAEVEALAKQVRDAYRAPVPNGYPFYSVAFSVVGELKRRAVWDVEKMHELLVSKQHDYGHGNINVFGLDGIIVRLSDKLARATNLRRRNYVAVNEAIEDTELDLVGYCVIAEMKLNGTFDLPLEGEEPSIPDPLEVPTSTKAPTKTLKAAA